MARKNVLLLLGGTYHDFDGFERIMTPVFHENGYAIQSTYEPDSLLHIKEKGMDIVAMYTCLGGSKEGDKTGDDLNAKETEALVKWVRGGGRLLALRAATFVGESNPELRRLMGGVFISHPPQFSFRVHPMYREHPITKGIKAFTVHDEFYIQTYDDSVDIHMAAFNEDICHPMVWSKCEGSGEVAHIAMGHGPNVWEMASYRQLLFQTLGWLSSEENKQD